MAELKGNRLDRRAVPSVQLMIHFKPNPLNRVTCCVTSTQMRHVTHEARSGHVKSKPIL